MTRFERERLARNLAEAIDDVYRVPRPRARRIGLVARQINRAIYIGWRNRHGTVDREEDQPS